MRCPTQHWECEHKELPSLIVEQLAQNIRDAVDKQLLKVKSHIGIEGNEKADKLAHDACRPHSRTDTASEGIEIREDIYWPHFSGRKIHNASGGAAAIVMLSQANPTSQCWPVSSE